MNNTTNGKFKDFIGIWDNAINEYTCKQLVKYYDWTIKNNYTISPDIVAKRKQVVGQDDEEIFLSSASPQYPESVCREYFNHIKQRFTEYQTNYNLKYFGNLNSYLFKVHKVKEKQGYHQWHYEQDSYETRDRILAFMTYLQAPSEGGETEFLHQSMRVDPVVGRTLIWPAAFTHVHRGNPPLKGEKLYITGWMHLAPADPQLR
mgnify:CR=1 FL=1|tara:strand:+ start:767 stop:1378 length:612 start_codon:yes stop_codon:yes gene_type:complete